MRLITDNWIAVAETDLRKAWGMDRGAYSFRAYSACCAIVKIEREELCAAMGKT